MDDVSKDLTLSSLLHHATSAAPPPPVIQQFLPNNAHQDLINPQQQENMMITNSGEITKTPLNSLSPNTCLCPHYGAKRGGDENNVVDRKRKRLMKNRESAARSRARRQAYTYELEAEVAHLMEENAKLRKQVEKLRFEAPGLDQNPKNQKLHRTLSNPI